MKKNIYEYLAYEKECYVKTQFENMPFFYMYKLNHKLTKDERNEIINILKTNSYDEIMKKKIKIEYGYNKFDKYVGFENFDIILYPDISRNNFVRVMIDLLKKRLEKQKNYLNNKIKFFEIKKTDPKTITFELNENRNYNIDDVNNKLEEIRKLDYFSIARNSGKYRREIRNFLIINNDDLFMELKSAKDDTKILIVDDIVTTGSTIKEILRKIKPINNKLDISILTFLGK